MFSAWTIHTRTKFTSGSARDEISPSDEDPDSLNWDLIHDTHCLLSCSSFAWSVCDCPSLPFLKDTLKNILPEDTNSIILVTRHICLISLNFLKTNQNHETNCTEFYLKYLLLFVLLWEKALLNEPVLLCASSSSINDSTGIGWRYTC